MKRYYQQHTISKHTTTQTNKQTTTTPEAAVKIDQTKSPTGEYEHLKKGIKYCMKV